jgi:hypothetical protein
MWQEVSQGNFVVHYESDDNVEGPYFKAPHRAGTRSWGQHTLWARQSPDGDTCMVTFTAIMEASDPILSFGLGDQTKKRTTEYLLFLNKSLNKKKVGGWSILNYGFDDRYYDADGFIMGSFRKKNDIMSPIGNSGRDLTQAVEGEVEKVSKGYKHTEPTRSDLAP